jgi:hypothetical protein
MKISKKYILNDADIKDAIIRYIDSEDEDFIEVCKLSAPLVRVEYTEGGTPIISAEVTLGD